MHKSSYIIEKGNVDAPTFFKLLVKYFPKATTFYVEGAFAEDAVACYESHLEEREYLPDAETLHSSTYRCLFTQELMEKLAALSEDHCSLELLEHLHLYKEDKPLLHWHDAFDNEIYITDLIPEEVVSKFAQELGLKYRVLTFWEGEDWPVYPKSSKHGPHDRTNLQKIPDLLKRFHEWKEGSYCCLDQDLHEMGTEIIPELIEFFRGEKDKDIRAFLVEVIYQFRERDVIPFLAEALYDKSPLVWQTALDGLITLDLPECIHVIEKARTRTFPKQRESKYFHRFLDEAIQQLREGVWGL